MAFVMAAIVYLSNTPNLHVSDPTTWINQPEYRPLSAYGGLLSQEGEFFGGYANVLHLEFILHKLSHLFFYALLAFFTFHTLQKFRFVFTKSLLIVFAFALLDELHQYLVVGRSGRLADVLLDTAAAACLILAIKRDKAKGRE